MDAPQIRYARTSDGVNIGYWVIGSGPPVVMTPAHPWSHAQIEWSIPPYRKFFERYAEKFTVIRYDQRGAGLSDREYPDGTREGHVRDLEAVLQDAGIESCAIFARMMFGPIAIRFAREHPERVTALVLWQSLGSIEASLATPDLRSISALVAVDWDRAIDAVIRSWGRIEGELVGAMTSWVTQSSTQELFLAFYEERRGEEADDLSDLSAPTLVVHRPAVTVVPIDAARSLTAGIPNARLILSEGKSTESVFDDETETPAILEFLAEALAAPSLPGDPRGATDSSFRTILFTDVVASTPLLAQLKDAKMRAVMRDHDAVLQAAVDEQGGRVVKEMGDAFMAEFAVPSAAVECAIAMQRGIQAQFADTDVPIRLRIGINAGEPVEEDGDLHGASVVIAKRLESAAAENGILVSEVVKQAVAGKEFTFAARGDFDLKGFDEPVRAWAVEWA